MPLCTKCGGWIDPFPPKHVCKPNSDGDSDFDDIGEMASVAAIASILFDTDSSSSNNDSTPDDNSSSFEGFGGGSFGGGGSDDSW